MAEVRSEEAKLFSGEDANQTDVLIEKSREVTTLRVLIFWRSYVPGTGHRPTVEGVYL
jgi:hypothetical protein